MHLVSGPKAPESRRAPELATVYPKHVLLAARHATEVIAEQEATFTPRDRALLAQAILTVALYKELKTQWDELAAATGE